MICLRSWLFSVMKILQVICVLRLLFCAIIENKKSQDLSLYMDILELQEKCWLRVRASDCRLIYYMVSSSPFLHFFLVSLSTNQSILKSCLSDHYFLLQQTYLVKTFRVSSVATSDLAKWIYICTKPVFLLMQFSKISSIQQDFIRLFSINYKPRSMNQYIYMGISNQLFFPDYR